MGSGARAAIQPFHRLYTRAHQASAPAHRQLQQMPVKPLTLRVGHGGATWSSATVHGGDALFVPRGFDADVAHIHVQKIGINTALHHAGWQQDALRGQRLHQGFGNHAAAHIAAAGAGEGEVSRLVDIHLEAHAHALSHFQKEVGKKRACRTAANHADPRGVGEHELWRRCGRHGNPSLQTGVPRPSVQTGTLAHAPALRAVTAITETVVGMPAGGGRACAMFDFMPWGIAWMEVETKVNNADGR